jgi:ABC-type branched-subunit amino acid transport system substrate-binding protein
MKSKRWVRTAAAGAAAGLLIALAAGGAGAGQAPEREANGTLKIGTLLPVTGQLESLGPPMVAGVQMAVQEINAAGGANGAPVELIETDDGTDPDIANTAVDRLLQEDVDVIIGAAASGVTTAVIDKITGAGVVECSGSNTGVQFTEYPDEGLYFRTAPPDNLQSQVLADLIVDDGNADVVVVARSDEYGEGFADFLEQELDGAGANVLDVILYDPEAASFDDVAEDIAAADPEAVAQIGFDEGGAVMTAAIEAGVGPGDVQWYGTDGMQSSTFYENVDPNNPAIVEGIRGTAPSALPENGEATFPERFQAFAPGTDTIFSGHTYDCAVIAALAADQAGSDASGEIADNIVSVTKKGTKCGLYADCLALIEEGENIDYQGAAGPLQFVKAGEPGKGAYDTWTFAADGSVEVIDSSIRAG